MTETHSLAELPDRVRQKLTDLKDGLERALGEHLVGLLVHGSAVRGGYREGLSDIDVIVVVNDASREKLDAISNSLQLARYSARIEAMILTESEIGRAADVFPLLYDDIQRCNVVLAGSDPFAGLTISNKNRRLRIEQELREAQIRLRRAVVDGMTSSEALAGAVVRKVRQIRGPLHALLRLHGIEGSDLLADVLAAAGGLVGVDTAPLARAIEAPVEAHTALIALLDAAVENVDRLEVEDAGG